MNRIQGARFAALIAAFCCLLITGAHAAGEAWADSVLARAAGVSATDAEPPLQTLLDSLGYDIDVLNDELGTEIFCGTPGTNTATMIIEVAGSAVHATSGYYEAGNPWNKFQLFGPSNVPGDSVQFNFTWVDSVGFYLRPNLSGNNNTWYSEENYNNDNEDHVWVFATGEPHEYLVCFEDLPDLGDADYQDLVIRVRFHNKAPEISFDGDDEVTLCADDTVCFDIEITDDNCQDDSIWVSMLSGDGIFFPDSGVGSLSTPHCFVPTSDGVYDFVFAVEDIAGAVTVDTFSVTVEVGTAPTVSIPDTSVTFCTPEEICLPLNILDQDCDVTSVTTNVGTYAGTVFNFDQLSRLHELGATLTQIGGGDPGKNLTTAGDFVGPVNSQSGVTVSLPNFVFASSVGYTGTLDPGPNTAQSSDNLLGPPTDMTFTLPGPGGPDGNSGDGSVDFGSNDWVILDFDQNITTCNGASVDFIVFTNTNTTGVARLKFRKGSTTVLTTDQTVPGGSSGTAIGGITVDLPDGLTYDRVRIERESGSFEVDAIAARVTPSPTSTDLCFTPDTAGVYTIIATVEDGCGNEVADTALVTVNLNQAPVADAGPDQSIFQCSSSQICLPVSFSDPDNNIATTQLLSGPGSLASSEICFTPASPGMYTFVIQATDSCGLTDLDTVKVTVGSNAAPVADAITPQSLFLCDTTQLCHTFTATDANGGPLTWTLLSGPGSITTGGEHCFTPTADGVYDILAVVTDSCGAADTALLQYDIDLNEAPIATDPTSPVAAFQCAATQICKQFAATDADGGSLTWTQLAGDGATSASGQFCFTPTGSGSYSATVEVSDSCGLADTISIQYDVEINDAPTFAFGADTTLDLCSPQEICLAYVVNDPQGLGGLDEAMVTGFGSIDTAANEICFTPATSGTYEFIATASDSCGEQATDTIVVTVSYGEAATIACPTGPIDAFLCGTDSVCQTLAITPASAVVTTSFGTYADGELCFLADTSGTYTIDVIAEEACGADTCTLVFNVEIGESPQITCPPLTELFACNSGDDVCVPVGVMGPGATVSISPIGTYAGGNACFPADTSGQYELTIIASTTCGADTCTLVADVTVNSAPIAVEPTSPVDTFICTTSQICMQFAADDADGGALAWTKLTGTGTLSASGEWCFSANGNGQYKITAVVTDSCGAADTLNMIYNVTKNSIPTLSLGNDTTIYLCAAEQVCLPIAVADADANIESLNLDLGNGTITQTPAELCFTPAAPGVYEFVATVTDSCGKTATDTLSVTVTFNQPPVANAGADQTIFQCAAAAIDLPASCTDPNNNLVSCELFTGPAGATYDGTNITFTPTGTWNYEFVIKATDSCGAVDFDTVVVYYELNQAPEADAGADQTIAQCAPAEICWPASCTDANGNLTSCDLIAGPGSYDGSDICFTPTTTGSYEFIIEATDDCGDTDRDTVVIDVEVNTAPVCQVPNDTVIFQCTAAQVCLPLSAIDAEGNLDNCQVNVGTLVGGNWCYTPTASQSVTVTVTCIDSCGAQCQTDFMVEFEINEAPEIAFGNDTSMFVCTGTEICLPYLSSDANDPRPTTVSLLSGPGALDEANSQVCFTPAADGTYEFVLQIEDECGEIATDTITVTVDVNEAPIADVGADQSLFLCDGNQQICIPTTCSDPDGNLDTCLFEGPGTYDGSQICFTPVTSGTFEFTLRAIDDCGLESIDTVMIDVTVNEGPLVSFPADSSLQLCSPQQICLDYSISDPNGLSGIGEELLTGIGSLDSANNQICFTPTTSGSYDFIISVTDSCGENSQDTMTVDVTFGGSAAITCPTGPIDVFLCSADSVCQTVAISPMDATVSVSQGTYANGELCVFADTTGTYVVEIIADSDCASDTCTVTFEVEIGTPPQITCPAPATEFVCDAGDQVCVPVGVMGGGATVSLPPFASYAGGQVCFNADTTGHYEIVMVANTTCGSDTCVIVVDVTVNSAPIADAVSSPVDTAMCASAEICYQFGATDADGGDLNWMKLTGNGTLATDGLWCFTPAASGSYNVTAVISDSCGAADTVSLTYNVTLNSAPTIALGNDTSFFICDAQELCLDYSVTDADNNISLEELLVGSATLDTTANQFCFTPDTMGVYTFILGVTDECGVQDVDTIAVTVEVNNAPVANAGPDNALFLCNVQEVCIPGSASDPDNNLDSAYVVGGLGTFNGNQICFTPDTAGVYSFILAAVDACGLTDEDTVAITIGLNSEPMCNVPNDTSIFQCSPTEISLPVSGTDDDGNFDHCELVSGPGSLVNGNWVFTPTADQSLNVVIMCLDECGAMCTDSFQVDIDINNMPVVDAGPDSTIFACGQVTICRPIAGSDPNNNLDSVWVFQGSGSYNSGTGDYCLTVPYTEGATKNFKVVLAAIDLCGLVSYDTVNFTVESNTAPTVDLPPDFVAFLEQTGELCFSADISDDDGNMAAYSVAPFGDYDPVNGEICFNADSAGTYCLEVMAWDLCNDTTIDTVCIEVDIDECIHVQIETPPDAIQGQYTEVDIFLGGSGKPLGGYNLLLQYDPSALTPTGAQLGQIAENCGWEYFQYRFGPDGNCGGCPSGLIRLVAIAETNNGAYHPGCFLDGDVGPIATIRFLVSNDRTLECQFTPIHFFWADCGDNTLSSPDGDTMWVARNVYDHNLTDITNHTLGFPTTVGYPDDCMDGGGPGKPKPIRCVDFTGGGVKIICAEDIDDRGDINLDGLAYTVADAVMFTNYFIYGMQAFEGNGPLAVEASIAASDVNADGLPLTVADLVFLIRVVTGDAPPIPRINPDAVFAADFAIAEGQLVISETTDKIGAIYIELAGEVKPELSKEAAGMEMECRFDGKNTRILIFNMEGTSFVSAGPVLKLNGDTRVKSIEIGSVDGIIMAANIATLPTRFELTQNYPNPFNPVTTIEFSLPIATEWNLTIFNILGQRVDEFGEKSEAGYQKIEWDAGRYASGVYFYRLQAGEFSATRKMILLK